MQHEDQPAGTATTEDQQDLPSGPAADGADEHTTDSPAQSPEAIRDRQRHRAFDWPALLAALAVAAFFALTARFNSQPSPSYIPAAVLSATGCGLLVTAVHTLRARAGVGLREAGLAGFGMALFQCAMTFTYPGVPATVATAPEYGRAFLITWGLVGLFATLLILAGATIGHLACATPRFQPAQDQDTPIDEEATVQTAEDEQEEHGERKQRSPTGYGITTVLLGLLPMMAGYVFAATYDFVMQLLQINQISPALYPTLSLLGGLLPWRLAAPINLAGANSSFIVFTLLWRIPDSALGNPNLFDVQALEPYVLNAAGLALALIAMHSSGQDDRRQRTPRGLFLLLELLCGLFLALPASLWMLRGLQGVLPFGNTLVPLPTIHVLNFPLFVFNVLTGALCCVLVGLIVRRQYQLWTTPGAVPQEGSADLQE